MLAVVSGTFSQPSSSFVDVALLIDSRSTSGSTLRLFQDRVDLLFAKLRAFHARVPSRQRPWPALFVAFFSRARIMRTMRFSGQGLIEAGKPLGRHQFSWRSFLTTNFSAATPSGPSL